MTEATVEASLFLADYVSLRSMGVHERRLPHEVPAGEVPYDRAAALEQHKVRGGDRQPWAPPDVQENLIAMRSITTGDIKTNPARPTAVRNHTAQMQPPELESMLCCGSCRVAARMSAQEAEAKSPRNPKPTSGHPEHQVKVITRGHRDHARR